jgi:hypothetical protein
MSASRGEAMRARRESLELVIVAGQGHAPLLTGAETIGHIAGFVANCNESCEHGR